MTTFTGQKTKRQLVVHGAYSSIPSCRTKITVVSRDIWNTSRYFKTCMQLLRDFSRNPLRSSSEPWLENDWLRERRN